MTAIEPTRVTVSTEDVFLVLHGPLGNQEYLPAVNRLYDACMEAIAAAGPVVDEDDEVVNGGPEVPF